MGDIYNWKPVFLTALRELPVMRHACEAADINRSTAWRARETDLAFSEAWDEAMEDGIDKAEQAAYARAVHGWDKPVIDKGRLAYRYERYTETHEHAETGAKVEEEKWRMVLDDKGQPIPLTTREHSDTLLVKVLAARRASYRTERTELTGADGGALAIDSSARASRIAQLMVLAKARKDFSDLA